ncbi:asparagine-linked glycosylation 9 protein [Capsaspora owczarzaki ATCC 30864]|uniref:Mannosyltransferase n=1 Tax=Capsaspora owczarzaki (strain ATCC 30864) TaxID=595528 RepID=A0A0D2X278_CAPO3|nr:asparagine-linked glycosylation 9 protein [Capsaspora owczarzaki ATCC 30864]
MSFSSSETTRSRFGGAGRTREVARDIDDKHKSFNLSHPSHPSHPSPQEHQPWRIPFGVLFKQLLALRLLAAIFSNISDCDETFNYWEPMHYVIYGHGMQTWEYSPEFAIRSYAYLLPHAVVVKLAALVQIGTSKVALFYYVRVVLAFLCAFSEAAFIHSAQLHLNVTIGRALLAFLLGSYGMFLASTAFLPSSFTMVCVMFAMACWMRGSLLHSVRFHSILGLVFSIAIGAILGWPFCGAVGLPMAIDLLLLRTSRRHWVSFIVAGFLAILVVLLPTVAIDSYFYGTPVFASLNIVLYNVFGQGGPDLYGVEPLSYYLLNGILNTNVAFLLSFVALPLTMLLAMVPALRNRVRLAGGRSSSTLLIYLMPLYLWMAIFFTRPHKEERFLFPAYPLIYLAGAIVLEVVAAWSSLLPPLARVARVLVRLALIVAFALSVSRGFMQYKNYHAPLDVYGHLSQVLADNADAAPHSIAVCVGKEWYRFPSHFFLPENSRLEFVASEFRAQLPQPYSAQYGTSGVPPNFNDMNREEPSRYFDINKCDYLIDVDTAAVAPREPRYALQTEKWKEVYSVPFLDAAQSPNALFRAFYVPFLSAQHCTYAKYVVLQRV